MAALRFIASLFLLLAVLALVADVTQLTSATRDSFMPLARYWSDFSPSSLAAAQRAVQTRVHPLLWDPVIKGLLAVPAWASLGALGLGLAYLGRRRKRVNIFTN